MLSSITLILILTNYYTRYTTLHYTTQHNNDKSFIQIVTLELFGFFIRVPTSRAILSSLRLLLDSLSIPGFVFVKHSLRRGFRESGTNDV